MHQIGFWCFLEGENVWPLPALPPSAGLGHPAVDTASKVGPIPCDLFFLSFSTHHWVLGATKYLLRASISQHFHCHPSHLSSWALPKAVCLLPLCLLITYSESSNQKANLTISLLFRTYTRLPIALGVMTGVLDVAEQARPLRALQPVSHPTAAPVLQTHASTLSCLHAPSSPLPGALCRRFPRLRGSPHSCLIH